MDGWCGQLYHNDFNSLANQGPFVERAVSRFPHRRICALQIEVVGGISWKILHRLGRQILLQELNRFQRLQEAERGAIRGTTKDFKSAPGERKSKSSCQREALDAL